MDEQDPPTWPRSEERDRAQIAAVIHRYCRALDRMDKELALSCWHAEGTDSHAPLYSGSASGFVEWLWPVHASMLSTHHMVGNTLIDLRGDEAGAETYWSVTLRIPQDGRVFDYRGVGRYIDIFAYRNGRWAIQHRQSIRDMSRTDELAGTAATGSQVSPQMPKATSLDEEILTRRDKDDYSYRVLQRY